MEIRKILTLQNFHFLAIPKSQSPPEEIVINSNTLHEGELGMDTQNARIQGIKGNAYKNVVRELNIEPKGRQDKVLLN